MCDCYQLGVIKNNCQNFAFKGINKHPSFGGIQICMTPVTFSHLPGIDWAHSFFVEILLVDTDRLLRRPAGRQTTGERNAAAGTEATSGQAANTTDRTTDIDHIYILHWCAM